MLLKVKDYLTKHKVASLSELTQVLNTTEALVVEVLEEWIKRGNVKKIDFDKSLCAGCKCSCLNNKCSFYQWVFKIVFVFLSVLTIKNDLVAEENVLDVTSDVQNETAFDKSLSVLDEIFDYNVYVDLLGTYDRRKEYPAGTHKGKSTFAVNEIDLGLSAKLTDFAKFKSTLEYDHDDYHFDEIYFFDWYLQLENEEESPLYLKAGQLQLPFANFESNYIYDPLIKYTNRIYERGVVLGAKVLEKKLDTSVTLFKSSAEKSSDNSSFDDWVFNAVFTQDEDYSLGFSYTTNAASGSSFVDLLVDRKNLENLPAAWSTYGNYQLYEDINFLFKYVGFTRHFAQGELYAEDDSKRRIPSAWDFEAQVPFCDDYTVSFRYSGSHDGGEEFPDWMFGPNFVMNITDEWNFITEYLHLHYAEGGDENIISGRFEFNI